MAQKKKVTATVVSQKALAEGIFDLVLQTEIAKDAKAGQFVSVYTKDPSALLPRPISICGVDKEKETIRLTYRVAGKGTAQFSQLVAGDTISVLGVLGNGYDLSTADGKRVLIMGGGIGVPPMLELAKELSERGLAKEIQIVMGYRNSDMFLYDEFASYGTCYVATEDGSCGSKGNVMHAIADNSLTGDIIYSCGPMPMLRAIKKYAEENQMEAYISLEERMACGVGACLGCVCKTKEIDHHSKVHNSRICTDGPVYDAKEVEI